LGKYIKNILKIINTLSLFYNDRFENLSSVMKLLRHVFICRMTENDCVHEAELTGIVSATYMSLYKLGNTFLLISDTTESLSKLS